MARHNLLEAFSIYPKQLHQVRVLAVSAPRQAFTEDATFQSCFFHVGAKRHQTMQATFCKRPIPPSDILYSLLWVLLRCVAHHSVANNRSHCLSSPSPTTQQRRPRVLGPPRRCRQYLVSSFISLPQILQSSRPPPPVRSIDSVVAG